MNRVSEFGAITEEEKGLNPDKEDSEDDGLEEVIDEGRFAFLKVAMADELHDPTQSPYGECWSQVSVWEAVDNQVGPVPHGQQDWRVEKARERLQDDKVGSIAQRGEGGKVQVVSGALGPEQCRASQQLG